VLNSVRIQRGSDDEAERPFWISYADLMTSLMVLFLVVMLASLIALTGTVTDLQKTRSQSDKLAALYKKSKAREARRDRREGRRLKDIDRFWDALARRSQGLGVHLNREASVIDFGSKARFGSGSDVLSHRDQLLLRRFTPGLLATADSAVGRRVLGRVVVEGYADQRGSYLYNLNLSLDRSQRVLCTLLAPGGRSSLSGGQKQRVRNLFLVGGFSFNSQRKSMAASRRVEMRLEFLGLGGERTSAPRSRAGFGGCALDA
jgi:outer membrane protein OmpA-like peptidoglycan-associated protein